MIDTLKNIYSELIKSSLFLDWNKKHKKAFLSGAFLQEEWQLDFYDPEKEIVGSFYKGKVIEDKLFKKPETIVKELDLEKVKLDLEEAFIIINESLKKTGEKEQTKIVLLQVIEDITTWNITIISSLFNIINFKIDAETGTIISETHNTPLSFRA